MKRTRTTLLPIVLAASFLIVAGCGGGDNGGEGAKTAPNGKPGKGDAPVSKVAMSEFKFDPSDVTARKGSTITVPNEGSVGHDLKVRKDGKTLGGTEVIDGGTSTKLKVSFKPGEYEMYCSVPGHEEAGMVGTFTVE